KPGPLGTGLGFRIPYYLSPYSLAFPRRNHFLGRGSDRLGLVRQGGLDLADQVLEPLAEMRQLGRQIVALIRQVAALRRPRGQLLAERIALLADLLQLVDLSLELLLRLLRAGQPAAQLVAGAGDRLEVFLQLGILDFQRLESLGRRGAGRLVLRTAPDAHDT